MTSDEFREILQSLEWCEERGFTEFAKFYREMLNDADRRGKLPPEAYPPEEPAPEELSEESFE